MSCVSVHFLLLLLRFHTATQDLQTYISEIFSKASSDKSNFSFFTNHFSSIFIHYSLKLSLILKRMKDHNNESKYLLIKITYLTLTLTALLPWCFSSHIHFSHKLRFSIARRTILVHFNYSHTLLRKTIKYS